MNGDPPEVSLVLPCRNQADHLEAVVRAYPPALEPAGRAFELILVPNACTDETPALCDRLAAADARVRVVPNPPGGWGRSVRVGLAAARGAFVGYTNLARTDPAVVPAILARCDAAAPCLAKARRVARGDASRSLGSWLYNLEARLLFGVRSGDLNGTPKFFPRSFLDSVALREDGDLLDLEVLALARRRGLPVVEVETRGFRRHGGRSTTTLRSAWRMYAGALALRWRGVAVA
jgi:hypothetical protein